ncbi:MAG: glycosyltransferase family 1 protein [Dehalococcoidia bacterium]|nr:glycosyltransferase family 1 protein [Dehalococcoidia bacterium]
MKIALVSPYDLSYPGGVTSHIAALGPELARRGHTVKILAPSSPPPPEIPGVEVITFGRSVPVPTAGSVARISFSVWQEPRLKATLEAEKFDVVHVHEPLMPFFSIMAVYSSPSMTVGTFHAFNEAGGRGYQVWKPVLGNLAERLHGRIAVSQVAGDYAKRYFPGDYEIIPNGIEVGMFSRPAPKPAGLSPENINLLFVGRVGEKRKGLRFLLAAYSTLKWEYPNLHLTVVGPGVPDADSYRTIGERNIQDVSFVGQVSRTELVSYYQWADIFCTPATGKESLGVVLLEAMAASKPIVATNIPGYAGVITDGHDGLLVPPRDEKALAGAIRRLIADAALSERLALAGRQTVRQYDWGVVASRVLDFYAATASGRISAAATA